MSVTEPVSVIWARGFGRECRAMAIAVAWGWSFVAAPANAAAGSLDPQQVYHLYFVDVGSLRGREEAFLGYVEHRWRTLVDDDEARQTQKGRIVFVDGPNGRVSTLDLDLEDRDQNGRVKKQMQLALASFRAKRKALDLGTVATNLKEEVVTRFDVIAAPEAAKSTPPQRLLFVHVIAAELLRTQGETLRSLDGWTFPESCLEDGAATAAAATFEQRANETFKPRGLTVPQLKIVLELVSSDDRRFGDTGERSAAQVLLGRSGLDGRAIALRDGLSCVEVEGPVKDLGDTQGRCDPEHTATPRPSRTRETCLPLDVVDTMDRVGRQIEARNTRVIAAFLKRPVVDRSGIASRIPTPPPPELPKPAPPVPAPPVPTPPVLDPPKPTPPVPTPPLPDPPKPTPPVPTPPLPDPPKPTPPVPAPPLPDPPKPTPPVPAPPVPEPRLRLSAAATRVVRSAAGAGWLPLSGRTSVTDGTVTVYLVPLGRTLADADPRRIVDATRGVPVRPSSGVYSLIARLEARIGCDASGLFSFSYSLTGNALAENGGVEFGVDVPDACRRGGGDVLFGKVTIK